MITSKLTVLHDDNASFADYSYEAFDYSRDTFSLTFVSADDKIYIGFLKPLNAVYVEMSTANTSSGTITVKYYNGSSFTAVTNQYDSTKGFNRSGFIQWDRNLTSEAKTTVNSTELYWYQISLSADSSAMVFSGINLVFSDDIDLKNEVFEISDYLPSGQSSHILSHVASREMIMQKLRVDGRRKMTSLGDIKDLTQFDLLDFSQIRLASTYLTLAKIFSSVSDQVDDVYRQKSMIYMSMFNDAFKVLNLALDVDDDGILDDEERASNNTLRFIRR